MTIRFALIGLGQMGTNHARVIQKSKVADLAYVVDPHPKAPLPPGCQLVGSVAEIDLVEIDAAVVATPATSHADIASFLIKQGIPTLIEKPLAASLADASRLVRLIDRTNVVSAVGHVERFNPAVRALRQEISAGRVGEVFQISTERYSPRPKRNLETGVIIDLAIHDIDLVRFVTESEYSDIYATTTSLHNSSQDDFAVAAGTLSSGIIFNHLANWGSPTKRRRILVIGDKGSLVANTVSGDLVYLSSDVENAVHQDSDVFVGQRAGEILNGHPREEPLALQLTGFIDLLEGNSSSISTPHDGLVALDVALEMLRQAPNSYSS